MEFVTHCLFQFAFASDSGFVSASLLPLSFDFVMDWTFPKLSMLVNWSDYLIHLKPVKYFDFAMEWTFPKLSMLVNWSDYLTHLDPAKYFGSGFVLGFGFVNLTTVGIQFVSVTYCPSLKPSLFVNLSGFVME